METTEHNVYTEKVPDVKKSTTNADGYFVIDLDRCIALAGDIKVEFYIKSKVTRAKKKFFRFWFNTFFVADGTGNYIQISLQGLLFRSY